MAFRTLKTRVLDWRDLQKVKLSTDEGTIGGKEPRVGDESPKGEGRTIPKAHTKLGWDTDCVPIFQNENLVSHGAWSREDCSFRSGEI